MPPTTPPFVFNHAPGFEIETKHKEAIRQLYSFAKIPIEQIMERYRLSKSTVIQILGYPAPERKRLARTGRPKELSDTQVDDIIEYLSSSWDNRVLNWV